MPSKHAHIPPTCRHVRTNGLRCGSPALREKPYCFHHERLHIQRRVLHIPPPEPLPETVIHSMQQDPDYMQRNPLIAEYYAPAKPGPVELDFPPLEDRESIQVALSMVLAALARNRIDPKLAAPILYGLQVASSNAKGLRSYTESDSVLDIITDEYGNQLAAERSV